MRFGFKKFIAFTVAAGMIMNFSTAVFAARREDPAKQKVAAGSSSKKRIDVYGGAPVKIAYIAHDVGTPNNQGWKEGIERECASWSNIKVDSYSAEESAEKQVQIMTDCINQGYNAIILQCSDGTALAPSVRQAEEAGIPVITLNLDCASDTVHSALVMAVDYDAGRMAADKMAEQMGGKGDIAIIQGVPGLARTDNLEQGFRDTIAKYSGIKIVDAQTASFQKDTAMTVMNSFLQSYPDLKGVFAINDAMAEGAALAAESANKKGQICIWGADGEKDALAMIESGAMSGTIYTNSWDEGSTAAKIALLMIGSEYSYTVLTETPKVIMEPIVVTSETVGSIAPEDRW
ncbi:MAG: sugar ABC transporter substrate-binding protein [Synergistaceae bacterium]|nr:sugar ABC transporter substrate-binding protein [Synergistaceae bacterium]MBQ3450549.1 sugar ABC transporter substrate-binding protein [Synergistaceae bacterium]MBQ3694503.1 sugar ABC transporter substrate-binding protein [Synergistaceae bacterium]MBR0249939.1 sugar ABC transporter substrate-binding protein [Synergistaceae bacterium]